MCHISASKCRTGLSPVLTSYLHLLRIRDKMLKNENCFRKLSLKAMCKKDKEKHIPLIGKCVVRQLSNMLWPTTINLIKKGITLLTTTCLSSFSHSTSFQQETLKHYDAKKISQKQYPSSIKHGALNVSK